MTTENTTINYPAPILAMGCDRSRVTSRFAPASTLQVIQTLQSKGWEVGHIKCQKSRKLDPAYAKHAVLLTHPDLAPTELGVRPTLGIVNANNGTSSLSLGLGLLRAFCANQLYPDNGMNWLKVRHTGLHIGEFFDGVDSLICRASEYYAQIDSMHARKLTWSEQHALAKQAIELRFDADSKAWKYLSTSTILQTTRQTDVGDDLWTVFNRVQENIIRPIKGTVYRDCDSGRLLPLRPVTGIDSSISLNKKLWSLAESYLN